MGAAANKINQENGTNIKGVRGVASVAKEAQDAGYENINDYLKNRKAKQAALDEKNRTRDSGNSASLLGSRNTLG